MIRSQSARRSLEAALLAFALAAPAAHGALPAPTPEEQAKAAEKKAVADREAERQAKLLAEAIDRVDGHYRNRMKEAGRPTLPPVPVAAAAAIERQLDKQKEPGPPTVHQGAPTTTMEPAKPSQKVESTPGGAIR